MWSGGFQAEISVLPCPSPGHKHAFAGQSCTIMKIFVVLAPTPFVIPSWGKQPGQPPMGTFSGLISAYWWGESELAGILRPKCTRFVFLHVQSLWWFFFCLPLVMWSVVFFSHAFFISSLYSAPLFGDCQGISSSLDAISSFASVFVTSVTLGIGNGLTWLAAQFFFPWVIMCMWFELYNLVIF